MLIRYSERYICNLMSRLGPPMYKVDEWFAVQELGVDRDTGRNVRIERHYSRLEARKGPGWSMTIREDAPRDERAEYDA